IRWWPNLYEGLFHSVYEYDDFRVQNFWELIDYVYGGWNYLLGAVIGGVMILFPFQVLKDSRYKKGRSLSFKGKWMILSGIVLGWILILGTFSNIWAIPWWYNLVYPIFALVVGLVFNTILYFWIDLHM